MSNQRSKKVRMGSSRRRLDITSLLAHDAGPETQTDPSSSQVDTDSVYPTYSEHGNQLDFKEPISETRHETSEDLTYASEKCGSLIHPPTTFEIDARANQSRSVSPKPQNEDMSEKNRDENVGMTGSNEFTREQCRELSESQMGMLPDESGQKTTLQMSKPGDDNMTPEVVQCSRDLWLKSSMYFSPGQPLTDKLSNSPQQLSDSIIHKEQEGEFRKENSNNVVVSSPGTIAESQEHLFQIEGICGDLPSLMKKEHEVNDDVNPLLKQSEHPTQSGVCPLLIQVPSQEEAEQEQMTYVTPDSQDTTARSAVVVESQPLLTMPYTLNHGSNQEMTAQDSLENTKYDHISDLSEQGHNMKEKSFRKDCVSEQSSDGTAVEGSGLDNNVKWTAVASNQEQDGDLDMKSSRTKRRMGSSRRLGNQGKGGSGDHSGQMELKVEMKCDSESLEGGTLGTSSDKADCLLLIPPQSEEIKETGSEDITDRAGKEIHAGGNIHWSTDISLGDVDDRKEDESEEKKEIVEKIEVIKIPLSQTMAEENYQETSGNMSRPYDEEDLCRAATEPQDKDIRPTGAVFDMSEPEHDVKEKTCSQVCESEGQANKPWELMEDTGPEEEEGRPSEVGAVQSECSSASADGQKDHTFMTTSGNISFNDGTVDNPTKQPIAELIEPEMNQSGSEKTVTLDSTIELKDRCNNDSNTTTEYNPQSEDVAPTSSNVTLSDSHSIDDLPVEGCLSTNMTEVNPLATLPQHVPSAGEDQGNAVEMSAPTSSPLPNDSAQVEAQMSTGLTHSLGRTEPGLNKSYLENENKNPVEMPEVEGSGLDKDVNRTEVASNQEQDGDLDMKSSRKKRRMGSSRRLGNQGKGGSGDHSGQMVESDFSADLNKTNMSFQTELKVEMKCDSESLEGGTLGTSSDKADCLLLIPPQSEEIKETGSEDITDRAGKEIHAGGNIHWSTDISLGDVDDRKEDESEEKKEIVEKIEVIKIPLSQTMAEENYQETSGNMSRPYDEEDLCRAATEPQDKDIRPTGAVFDMSEPEHDVKEKTCSQVCESEGQANNKPWELMEDTGPEEEEGRPSEVGAVQSECSSASADGQKYHTFMTTSGNISFNDGTVDNPTKQPIAELIEPEMNQSGSEKTVTLDSTIELKDRCNNDSNTTTEYNPQSEDVAPTSSNVTLSDSHSIDDPPVEGCLSTNMTEVNPLATLPQHVPLAGEDQGNAVEMSAPASSPLPDECAQVGAQMSTGLTHSFGRTEPGLNKSYLENENKNPVEMPEVEGSGLDKGVNRTEVASNQEQDGDLDMKSSRKKRRMGSSRRLGNKGKGGSGDHSGQMVESDFSADLNKTNMSFQTELKVEMKCDSESLEGGTLGTSSDKADCLLLIPPQSEEIKETGSEDITDTADKEIHAGGNIHWSTDISLGDVDDRKEDESEEKKEIVENIEVIKIPLSQTMAEENYQETSGNMSRPYDEEDLCRAATEPQDKDIMPTGVCFPMLVHNSLSKENTPHSLDINSSILFAPVSDIRDNDGKMDTAGQHPTAHLSNLDQISGQGNSGSLPPVEDHDKHVLRRRKMGSSRWTKGGATGSQKGTEEAQTTEDKEMEKDAVLSENIPEEDPQKLIPEDNKGAEKFDEEEPNQIDGDTDQSMNQAPNFVRRKLGSNTMTSRMTPIRENSKEKQDDSELSEDRKTFKDELKMKVNKDNETEQNAEISSETGVKPVNTTLSALPINAHVEGRRRKLGSQRTSRGQHHHDYPLESKDHGAFGDHLQPTEPLSRQITGNATLTFDTRANCLNVVMVGSSNVGKTSFMNRIQSGSFSPGLSASIGIDTCIHALPVDGRDVMLQLWDTAGQERFHSISKQILHKGQAFLLMYDITSSVSFTEVRYWISCIQEAAGEEVIMLLLGNKSDCAGRQVPPSEGQLLAKEYNMDFSECSAATGEHVVSSIESLARKLTENHKIEEDVVLQQQQQKKGCC